MMTLKQCATEAARLVNENDARAARAWSAFFAGWSDSDLEAIVEMDANAPGGWSDRERLLFERVSEFEASQAG